MIVRKNNLIARLLKDNRTDPLASLVAEYLMLRDRAPQRLEKYEISLVENDYRPPGRISPSSIGGCKRRAVLAFVGYPGKKIIDADLARTFQRGNWIHHEWYATFLDMQIVLGDDRFTVVAIEKPIKIPRLFIRGRYDTWVRIEGKDLLVDVKSQHPNSYTMRFWEGADTHHAEQVHPYMRAIRVDESVILYDDKSSPKFKAMPVSFNETIWQKLVMWSGRVVRAVDRQVIPNKHPECTKGSFMANGCAFSSVCYGGLSTDEIAEKAYGGKREQIQGAQAWWDLGLKLEKLHQEKNKKED